MPAPRPIARAVLLAGLVLVAIAGPAAAEHSCPQDYCTPHTVASGERDRGAVGEQRPAEVERDPESGAAEGQSARGLGGLPITGADVLELVGIGAAAVVVGSVVLRRSKRVTA